MPANKWHELKKLAPADFFRLEIRKVFLENEKRGESVENLLETKKGFLTVCR